MVQQQQKKTFEVLADCENCNFKGKVTPPYGTKTELFPCPNCGFTGLHKKKTPASR